MKAITTLSIALFAALGFSSCATQTHAQHKGAIGAGIGATAGAIIGKQSGNTGKGAALGALIGGVTGHAMGNAEDKRAEQDNY